MIRSYDENLIYVNDFEIFRPYLVRSGQQEGLSFINPEMTRSVSFYNGGLFFWQRSLGQG